MGFFGFFRKKKPIKVHMKGGQEIETVFRYMPSRDEKKQEYKKLADSNASRMRHKKSNAREAPRTSAKATNDPLSMPKSTSGACTASGQRKEKKSHRPVAPPVGKKGRTAAATQRSGSYLLSSRVRSPSSMEMSRSKAKSEQFTRDYWDDNSIMDSFFDNTFDETFETEESIDLSQSNETFEREFDEEVPAASLVVAEPNITESNSFLTGRGQSKVHRREVRRPRLMVPKSLSGLMELRLFVDDYPHSVFRELAFDLMKNETIQKLQIVRMRESDNARVQSNRDMRLLFRAIRNMPKLHTLVLTNFSPADNKAMAEKLKGQASIRNLKIHYYEGSLDEDVCQMMTTLPWLKGVEVDAHESFPLGMILECRALEVLKVTGNDFRFDDEHFSVAFLPLETHRKIKSLVLQPDVSPLSFRVLAYSLMNNSSLETLHFSLSAPKGKGDKVIADLVQALEVNRKLKVLKNYTYESLQVGPRSREKLLKAIQGNKTLQKFHLFQEDEDFYVEKNLYLERNVSSSMEHRGGCSAFLCLAG